MGDIWSVFSRLAFESLLNKFGVVIAIEQLTVFTQVRKVKASSFQYDNDLAVIGFNDSQWFLDGLNNLYDCDGLFLEVRFRLHFFLHNYNSLEAYRTPAY